MTGCPSDLRLEVLLLEPQAPEAQHAASCRLCQARLAEMRAAGEEFQREVYPATVAAVTAAVRAPSLAPPARRWVRLAAPLAAAAAVIAFLAVRYWTTAAPTLALAVYVADPSRATPVGDGEPVPAAAALRFEVHPSSPCNLWILSVDPTGDIARLYPPKGDRASEAIVHPAEQHFLPTTALLDGRAGPERIFAVCTKSQVPWNTVKQAAAKELEKGDEAVRRLRSIGGLPAGSSQTSVLLEKRT
jgi:hypothetical protein